MALSENFKKTLTATLKRKLKKYGIVELKDEHEKLICGHFSIYSDFRIKLRIHDIEFLIETESNRVDPVHNLIKTLMWLDENKPTHFLILLHVFDESYVMEDRPRKAMCEFVYRSVQSNYRNFVYCPLNIGGLTSCLKNPQLFQLRQFVTELFKLPID